MANTPRRWLLPIDGSANSLKAVAWAIAQRDDWRSTPELHLLNVQAALPRDISRFIAADELRDYHRDEGVKALAAAEAQLKAAGLDCQSHISVGDCAETIAEFADSRHCDQIVIGTRGHSGLGGTLLGSVATQLAHLSRIPLLLVR